ncbi:MAG: hypothetical protein O7E52_00570 [Candidatus Poribacteria bacterium]|nr:hypothetical protein [Candidatus Poribacteria bacterium]
MYTQADYLFYYFVEVKELHILPMPQTRDWFSPRINEFKERTTSTPVGGGSYRTVGRLVPRTRVKNEVANVKIIDLRPFL